MNTVAPHVDSLDECNQFDDRGIPMVWRCAQVTMVWMDGMWRRLETWPDVRLMPIDFTVTGPFFQVGPLDKCDFSDYRTADMSGFCHHHLMGSA